MVRDYYTFHILTVANPMTQMAELEGHAHQYDQDTVLEDANAEHQNLLDVCLSISK